MTDDKMKEIIASMQGMTYLEWKKVRRLIDGYFECEAAMQNNKIEITAPEDVLKYRRSLL